MRLTSGKTGLVARRGLTLMTPVVAVMTSASGASWATPRRRNTAQAGLAVHSVLAAHAGKLRISPQVLMAVAADTHVQ